MARALAHCLLADRFALTLLATIPTDTLTLRIPYDEPIADAAGLRKATEKLAHRARAMLPERERVQRFADWMSAGTGNTGRYSGIPTIVLTN